MTKKKLKLKGRNSKKISEDKQEKMQVTLDAMQENRHIDSDNLRDIITKKLEWAKQQKEKGARLIEQNQIQLNRLEGIILFIEDLLHPIEEPKEEK